MNMGIIIAGISFVIAMTNAIISVFLYVRSIRYARNVFCLMRANDRGEIEIHDLLA